MADTSLADRVDSDFFTANLRKSYSLGLRGESLAGAAVRQVDQRLTPVLASGVLNREGSLTEGNELESAPPCARYGDAPMPASALLEDMQNRGGWRISLRSRHGSFSPHIAAAGARLQTPCFQSTGILLRRNISTVVKMSNHGASQF
jgi:hypothetical protein